jgi:hypothetical protein
MVICPRVRSEVFGGEPTAGCRVHWVLPLPISYPDPERLTGYCFREPRVKREAYRDLESM